MQEREYSPEGSVISRDTDVLGIIFWQVQEQPNSTEYSSSSCNYLWVPRLVLTDLAGNGSITKRSSWRGFLHPESSLPLLQKVMSPAQVLSDTAQSPVTPTESAAAGWGERKILRQICHHTFATWGYKLSCPAVQTHAALEPYSVDIHTWQANSRWVLLDSSLFGLMLQWQQALQCSHWAFILEHEVHCGEHTYFIKA